MNLAGAFDHYVNRAVQKLSIPSWMTFYRYMKCIDPWQSPVCQVKELSPATMMDYPLPANVATRELLNHDVAPGYPHSFFEVPSLHVKAAYCLQLKDVSLLHCSDRWNNDFYAIVTEQGRSLIPPGIGYRTEHRHAYRTRPIDVEAGTWCFGMWLNNYYMWHVGYMTNVLRAVQEGLGQELVMPEASLMKSYVRESLDFFGLASKTEIGPTCPHLRFKRLSIVQDFPYRGEQVKQFRNAIATPSSASAHRLVYISRHNATFRKVLNEDDVCAEFASRGWEIRCMEEHSYREQVQLMSETRALAGMQGAGFANMLFMPTGGHVLEFSMVPSANFYALASALEHHYWLHETPRAGKAERALYDHTTIDLSRLSPILDLIEAQF